MSAPQELSEYALKLHEADNVATAVRDIPPGEYRLDGETIRVSEAIAPGFKLALRPIGPGQTVTKYGYAIGRAETSIAAGEGVHVHNMASNV